MAPAQLQSLRWGSLEAEEYLSDCSPVKRDLSCPRPNRIGGCVAERFFAHASNDTDTENWHALSDHLIATGQLAAEFGAVFGVEKATRLAGLLHDLGKYSEAFQKRLHGSLDRVDHSTAGAVIIKQRVPTGDEAVIAELIAFAIAGHHAGLADRTGRSSLGERLKKKVAPLDLVWETEIAPDPTGLMPAFDWSHNLAMAAFQFGFLGRMIFSCLVDADYRDTETYFAALRGEMPAREWPALEEIVDGLIVKFDSFMDDLQAGSASTDVNDLRRDVLAHVRAGADMPRGFFTLTVPTGGGKTLTSLGFALDHAKRHGLSRIIYAIPFTSIIDQTVSTFAAVLGDEYILEHHSALDEEKPRSREQRDKLNLAMEDWAAPLIVTTNVQLFESLFANRPSRCRKLHNIAGSVIVLDEAQTIPLRLLRPCVEALRELVCNYGCSIVLCTATQPALSAPEFHEGLPLAGRELAPDPRALARQLKRVTVHDGGEMDDDALVAALRDAPQGLIIVNTRQHALNLYHAAREAELSGLYHLTTRQYAAHRRLILAEIRQALDEGRPCRLIATSLVEAGIDVDFPRLWRATAGLDQIAQAAGRCNREGRRPADESIVTIFQAPDNPPPREIAQLAADFARMASHHADDLLSPAAIRDYFGEVYWRKGDGLDGKQIMRDFALNGTEADIAYRTIAGKFQMIESGMVPVIVARERHAQAALERLGIDGVRPGVVARALQPYLVQVPPRARNALLANGHACFAWEERFGDQFCVVQNEALYRQDIGLLFENVEYLSLEGLVV